MGQLASLEVGTRSLNICWSDGHSSTFHYLWLRDNCPQSRHPQLSPFAFPTPASAPPVALWPRLAAALIEPWPAASLIARHEFLGQ